MRHSPENGWFPLVRLGLLETTKFIYVDRVNIKYSKEYALEVASALNKLAGQFIK